MRSWLPVGSGRQLLAIPGVAYTGVDWQLSMGQAGGIVNGRRHHVQLQGDTGPVVSPAGFVLPMGLPRAAGWGTGIHVA